MSEARSMMERPWRRLAGAVLVLLGVLSGPVRAAAFDGPGGFDVLRELTDLVKEHYPFEVSEEAMRDGALRGVLEALDPHSRYISPEEMSAVHDARAGIGALVEEREGRLMVADTVPGGPAEAAGVQRGDEIVLVDGRRVRNLGEAVTLIRGEPGSEVRLVLLRRGDLVELRVRRAAVRRDPVDTRYLDRERVGYIRIDEFQVGVAEKVAYIYGRYRAMRVRGVILDLRDNPGGEMDEAIEVADALVPGGTVVRIVKPEPRTVAATGHGGGPRLVVLVNRDTASAAELLAAAIQDNKAGLLVGKGTYGKATMQSMFGLSNGGGVILTTGYWLTPAGRDINGRGLTPDVPAADERSLEAALAILARAR